MEVFQKLLSDVGDRDIVNIQLITPDKEEEQVKWTLKIFELNSVHGVLPFDEDRNFSWKMEAVD
jgi:hypothetical protein